MSDVLARIDPLVIIRRNRIRILVVTLVAISTFSGFLLFDNLHNYMPWQTRVPLAIRKTIMVHFGLWLSVLGVRNKWRFLIAMFLIPSGLGAYLLLWHRGLITALPVLAGLGWLLFKIIRGEKLDP
jgi:hypothetical protein